MTLIEKLKELGYSTISQEYHNKILEWLSWYEGKVKGFHRYKIRNGQHTVNCKRYSLGMGKKVSEDWANLMMNEKASITAAGKPEQEFLVEVFEKNNFRVKANEMQEFKFALGTGAYIPRVVGQVDGGSATGIELDYVLADHIWPLSWHNGTITECAFDNLVTVDGSEYVYIQIHRKNKNGEYVIENHVCTHNNGDLGNVDMNTVKGFEDIPSVVETKSKDRQFVIDRPNIANNISTSCPMGVSVYANAIDALEGADVAYDAFVQDFITGRRRLFVSPAATSYIDGEPVFDPNDVALYVLPEDVSGENKPIQQTGGSFAVEATSSGVQTALNVLSSKCGFGENHYKFDRGSIATATQVVSENSTLFRTIKKHEIILHDVLDELCRVILRLGNSALGKNFDVDTEITIDFDDSIIEDKTAERNNDRQDLAAGILNDWEYRAKWYNEDEATAKKMLPRMEDLTTESQDEVE